MDREKYGRTEHKYKESYAFVFIDFKHKFKTTGLVLSCKLVLINLLWQRVFCVKEF